MDKKPSHIHIKALFLGFFVFIFFMSTLELDPTMGKGMKASAEKFDEGGYMSFEETGSSNIMLTNKEGGETLPMSKYQKQYVEKLQVVLSSMQKSPTPTAVSLHQVLFYLALLREKPCSNEEMEEGLCVVSEEKGGYLKDEMKMQQVYYANKESINVKNFYTYAAMQVTAAPVGEVPTTSSFVVLLYKALYDKSEKSIADVRSAFEARNILLPETAYTETTLTSAETKEIVVRILKGLLQNRKSSLKAQSMEG